MQKILFFVIILLSITSNAQKDKGYEFSFETGYSIGFGDNKYNTFNIVSMINGYRIHPQIYCAIGFGIGYTEYESAILPIYALFKHNFNKNNTSPFLLLNMGYTFGDNIDKLSGIGLMGGPYIGIDFNKHKKTSFYLMTGVHIQRSYYYLPNKWGHSDKEKVYQYSTAIDIKIGIRL